MNRERAFVAVILLLSLGALLFRIPDLGNRPMHGDEAVHAFKFRELWEKGSYRYDPNEFHGPTIYYAALPSVWMHHRQTFADTNEADYRLPIAVFGAAIVPLILLMTDGLGKRAAIWSALFLAISPAFVFYSRYYIQEILLVFCTMGMIGCGWRFARSRRSGWLIAASVFTGLMIATKETAVLTFAAMAIALGMTSIWTRKVDGCYLNISRIWPNRKLIVTALAAVLLTSYLFLSGFLTNLHGPLDYLRSYTPWLSRAHGTDLHRHPWYYYLQILLWSHEKGGPIWSEGIIVGLGVVGAIYSLLPKQKSRFEGSIIFGRFITFSTILLIVIYSVIPYKTPWCVLNMLLGIILLAGTGVSTLVRLIPGTMGKILITLVILAGCVQLTQQSYRTSFVAYTDPRNPYVYAQTVPDIEQLQNRLNVLSAASPQDDAVIIKVFSIDNYYWPLPWNLRRFPNIGYWNSVPSSPDAPIVLASPEFDAELTRKLDSTHLMTGYFGIRPGVFLEVWVRMDLWKSYLDKRKAEKPEQPGEN